MPVEPGASAAPEAVGSAAPASLTGRLTSMFGLEGNPYFSAGFALGVAGTGLAAVRGASRAALTLAQRHLLVTLEVTSKDKSYPWVLQWLTEQAQVGGGGGGGGGALRQHVSVDTVVQRLANGKVETRFEFSPCPGRHVLRYRGQMLMVERQREQQTVDLQTGQPWESVKLTALGRSPEVFSRFLSEAQAHASSKQEQTTTIYTNWGTEWRPFGAPRRRRPLSSVVLNDGIAEHIVGDVREFVESQAWYIARGIPYRRGYLLHGTPGSGKSSFVAALAGSVGYDICMLNLAEPGLTDDRLAHALTHAPPASLILLEDIDSAFLKDRDPRDRRASFVTFSGLLNALDGVAAGEERLLFMTTNHIERLDPALIRPGRVDVIHHVGDASPSQIRRLFLKFFPDQTDQAGRFVTAMEGCTLSMALLQSYLMVKRHSADGACDGAAEFAKGVRESRDARAMSTLNMGSHTAPVAGAAESGTGTVLAGGSRGTTGGAAANTDSSKRPTEHVDD